jgi:hypothetical protein
MTFARHIRHTLLVACAAACIRAPRAGAQLFIPAYTEYRADGIFGRGATAQGGLGAAYLFGPYVRTSIDGAAGATWYHDETRASGRVDLIARFLLDPFREAKLGLSMGGGVTVPYASGDPHVRPLLTAVIDLEGRMRGDITPAVQVGLGGGTRIGVVLRTSPPRWR